MSRSAPQGLKPTPIASPVGTAEAVPFRKPALFPKLPFFPKPAFFQPAPSPIPSVFPISVPFAKSVSLQKAWMGRLLKVVALMVATSLLSPLAVASRKDKNKIPAMRWVEGSPGCTFSRDDDGKYRYGLWSDEAGVVMAVDSQELEKVHRRHQPFFAVLLTVRYRGQTSLEVPTENISLQFMKHFQFMQTALDPDDFSEKVQNDADTLNDETARQVEKHPEQREQKEAYVRAFLKDSVELQEFVGKNSLRPTRLSPGKAETGGWVLFSTDSKWISGWKKQEEFVLRVPLAGKVFEFPFRLPPKAGETILRKRE
jgi:hypothetical protein